MDKKTTKQLFVKEQVDGVYVYKKGLLSDPDFRKVADKLLRSLHAKYPDPITLNCPPISDFDNADGELANQVETQYKIPFAEFLAMFEYQTPVLNRPFISVDSEPFFDGIQLTEQLVIRAPISIRKEDFDNQWTFIENVQQNSDYFKTRLRDLDEPELLYAIWKARHTKPKPTKFKDIAKQLNEGQLPGYKHTKTDWQYSNVNAYYNRHKHLLEDLYL